MSFDDEEKLSVVGSLAREIESVDELMKDMEIRTRCIDILDPTANVRLNPFQDDLPSHVISTAKLKYDEYIDLLSQLDLLDYDKSSLKNQKHKPPNEKRLKIKVNPQMTAKLVKRRLGVGSEVEKEELKRLAKLLSDAVDDENERMIKLLEWGVKKRSLLPEGGWRNTLAALLALGTSSKKQDRKKLWQVLSEMRSFIEQRSQSEDDITNTKDISGSSQSSPSRISIEGEKGVFEFNTETGDFRLNDVEGVLTPGGQKFRLVKTIVEGKDNQASHDRLVKRVWKNDDKTKNPADRDRLSRVLYKIKKDLGIRPKDDQVNEDIFNNQEGYGYRIVM